MTRSICTSLLRKQIKQSLLIAPAALAGAVFFLSLDLLTGQFYNPKNILPKIIVLFLLASGLYLAYSGLRALLFPAHSDLAVFLRPYLHPNEKALPIKDLFALVDRDLNTAADFAGGRVLIGEDWLFVRDAWGTPVIRLDALMRVERRREKGRLHLKFLNANGAGPVTGVLSEGDACVIEQHLREKQRV